MTQKKTLHRKRKKADMKTKKIKPKSDKLLDRITGKTPKSSEIKTMKLNMYTGILEKSRKGHGHFNTIFEDPKQLLKPESYMRRLLYVMGTDWLGSEDLKNKFNAKYDKYYERLKTQGSISHYLSKLETLGLVDCLGKHTNERWAVKAGVNVNDSDALYKMAKAHQAELEKLTKPDNKDQIAGAS